MISSWMPARLRAADHPLLVEVRIEEADVVGDGAGEELVLLHHGGDLLAVGPRADVEQRDAVDQHLAARRLEQAEHDLHQRRLAAAGRAHDGDELARLDREVDVLQDERLGLGVAEAHVAQLDPALDRAACRPGAGRARVSSGRQRDVGQALEVQAEDAELERLLDQLHRLLGEVLLVAHEGEDHADRQGVGERQPRREIDGDDVLEAEDQRR